MPPLNHHPLSSAAESIGTRPVRGSSRSRQLLRSWLLAAMLVPASSYADSVRIVDFGHDWGVGFYRDVTATRYSNIDVDGDGLTTDDIARGWTFSLTTPLNPLENNYDSQLPSARFYGGIYAAIANRAGSSSTSAPSEGHINQNHELRDDWNLMALPSSSGQPQLESYEAAGLWLWKKQDFLNGAAAVPVSFSAGDNISVFISRYWGGVNWARWIIQNGSQFYVSEPTFAGLTEPVTKNSPAGTSSLVTKKAHAIDPTTVRWAPYDPATPPPRAMFFDWLASPDYQYRSFDDVQSVGFLVQRDLAVGEPAAQALTANEPIAVKWNAVKVTATIPAPTAGSPNIDLVPVAGTSSAPAIWVSPTEISYRQWLSVFRWADSNQRPKNFTDGIDRWIPPYSFERDGAIGSAEASLASVHQSDEPVTTITWYDAIVWCNALSELESREPAYYADAAFTVPFREVFPRNLTQARDQRLPVYWKVSAGGYRLPTESEWKALAADASTAGAWIGTNSSGKTQSVATQSANSLGLYDMVGNVAEFIWDSPNATFDPATQTSHKVLGGSFRYPADENAASLIPFGEVPSQGTASVGFRPVRNGDGSLPPASGSFPERVIVNHAVVPPAVPMTQLDLQAYVTTALPLVEVPASGRLEPIATVDETEGTHVRTENYYDLDVGATEIPYALWMRVKQWSERSLGYRFNYSGDMGSARFNPQLSRGPDEPVTQISWFDAVIWCNALSELMGLDPVYRKANGDIEREAPAFRLSAYEYYGYPNTGQYIERAEVDTSMDFELLQDPYRSGYRLPHRFEARIYGNTAYSHTDALNKTTTTYGWFKNDAAFGGNGALIKAMPVGTKQTNVNGLHDILGNVQEWTCSGTNSLFGPYHYGNDFGWASNTYPHTMNRQDHVSVGRYFIGMRVVKLPANGNLPPSAVANPGQLSGAHVGVALNTSLTALVTDPNENDAISFALVSGPAWLGVAPDGTLSGTPGASDEGVVTFTVTASDLHGASVTFDVALTVGPAGEAPAITTQPGSLLVGVDWSAALTVEVSGTGPFTYQWYFNGTALDGATGPSYEIPSSSVSQSGEYTVAVTTPYGSVTSSVATVTVDPELTGTGPDISLSSSPLTATAPAGTTTDTTVQIRNLGIDPLAWSVSLPQGVAPVTVDMGQTLVDWNFSNAADGLTITGVASHGSLARNWGSLTGAATLDGALRISTNSAAGVNSYTDDPAYALSSGVCAVEIDIAGWHYVDDGGSQWFQLNFMNDRSSTVTAGVVLQSNAGGLALWGRALGAGTNIGNASTWTGSGGLTGTPVRQYGADESDVTLRLVVDFDTDAYDIYYRDSSTGGAFVKSGITGTIDSTRGLNHLRLRVSGNWGEAGEHISIRDIRVYRAGSVPTSAYEALRGESAPAYAWRDIVGGANGGTRFTALDNTDDQTARLAFPAGFRFPFFNDSIAAATISDNGFLTFVPTTDAAPQNLAPADSSAPAGLLAWMWDDLALDARSSTWYRLDADGLVITFNDWKFKSGPGDARVTAQLVLHTDGTASINYQSVAAPGISATVGLNDPTGTLATSVSVNDNTTLPVAGECIMLAPAGTVLARPAWIVAAQPSGGSLGTLESTGLTLGLDTTGLANGLHESSVVIISNDAGTPSLVLPVELSVVQDGGAPAIAANTPPSGSVAIPYTTALQSSGGVLPISWSISSGTLPAGLALVSDGTISGTPAIEGTFAFEVGATDANNLTGTRTLVLTIGAPSVPQLETGALPVAEVNADYSVTLAATDGVAPYAWSIASGTLPEGLVLDAGTGVISGVAIEDGDFSVGIRLTDAYGQVVDVSRTISVPAPPALAVTSAGIPAVVTGETFSINLAATGGYGGYVWSQDGSLPVGLTLSAEGVLSGTLGVAGSQTIGFTVTDRNGNTAAKQIDLVAGGQVTKHRAAVENGGWNLHYVRYWDQANYFNDLMMSAGEWQQSWKEYAFEYDANGYPVNIPAGTSPACVIYLYEPGEYVLTWVGEGSVILSGSGVTNTSEDLTGPVKRRVYLKTSDVTTKLTIRVMIQNQVPATDIHVWSPGTEPDAQNPDTVFTDTFLERLEGDSSVLRFMDWGATNSSKTKPWDQRPRPGFYTQDSPTAYEYMIELANATDKDLWICVPHLADADYTARLARLIRTGMDDDVQVCSPLKPGLKVYVEWSNEVWNSTFPQYKWAVALAKERLGLDPSASLPSYNEVWRIIGEKHAETFKIFSDVFAGDPESRLVRVLGTQIGGGLIDLHMVGVQNIAALDPDHEADYQPDAVAIGAYFGHSISTWILNNVPGYATPTAADYDTAFAEVEDDILTTYASSVAKSSAAAARHNLELMAYEGGQHIVGKGSEQNDSALGVFLRTLNRDARMGDMIALSLDIWERCNGGLFMAYQETGPYGSYGSWGFREYWYQTDAEAAKAGSFNNWLRRIQQGHLLTRTLEPAVLGDPVFQSLEYIAGSGPATLAVVDGALPLGLALNADGTFSGMANDYGVFTFTVRLTDAEGLTDERSYDLTVLPEPTLLYVPAKADAYVAGWSAPSNYGSSSDLLSGLTNSRVSYAKWDLSTLAGKTVNSAVVRIAQNGGSSGNGTYYAHDGALWDEDTITWLNRPALDEAVVTFAVDGSLSTHDADVTAWVGAHSGDTDAGLTLASDVNLSWYSNEAPAGGPLLIIDADPLVLVPTTWANWIKLHLAATAPADQDPAADPDGDGRTNLVEYALGSSPLVADGPAPAPVDDGQGNVTYTFPYHAGLHDLHVRVTASTDEVNWDTVLFDSATDATGLPVAWQDVQRDCTALTQGGTLPVYVRMELMLQ